LTQRIAIVVGALVMFVLIAVLVAAIPRRPSPSPTPGPTHFATSTPSDEPTESPEPSTGFRSPGTVTPAPIAWRVVTDDTFDGKLPAHWRVYDGRYLSGPHNCAAPSQVSVHDGALDLRFSHLASGQCGPAWYSGGLALSGVSAVDARVTVRYRVVQSGGITAHRIIPMRFPDDEATWPKAGEEDYCEGESLIECKAVMHFSNNIQDSHTYDVDLTNWHTISVERHAFTVVVSLDGKVVWTYEGSATTLPATLKHVVLQQECPASCPIGTTGTEDILIDAVKVEVPA